MSQNVRTVHTMAAAKKNSRSYGSGSITARGPGKWLVQAELGADLITGKRLRLSATVLGTKKDAQTELTNMLSQRDQQKVDKATVTLRQLIDLYFDARPNRSPHTIVNSLGYVDRYLPEALGGQLLKKVTVFELDRLYRHLEVSGGVCRKKKDRCTTKPCEHGGGDPLSAATVNRLFTEFHAAFEQAITWGWVSTNPASHVTHSEVVEKDIDVDPDEVIRLLGYIDTLDRDVAFRAGGSPIPDFVDALLATGARPAEVCALQYGQLSLDRVVKDVARPQVRIDASMARGKGKPVRKETKTKKTRYPVLDAYTADVLRRRRSNWMPAALATGVPLETFHVFPSGKDVRYAARADSISRAFRKIRDAAGCSDQITLRNLRHLVASLLVDGGMSATTVAARLGNSAHIVQQRYAHMLDSGNAAAAEIVNKRLGRSS